MKLILSFLLSVVFLFSQELELDNLLKEYGESQELYLKTKKESAGHLIVFSRADLDKMQAYTLNDVLKTLRMFTLQAKKNGMTTLTRIGDSQLSSHSVKIYINSHELNSATSGNPLTQYGQMGLYFIDHIEVYQSGNSVTYGNEPASMIIKLYTKEPSRENATSTQFSVDSEGSSTLQAIDARVFDEYSYLANIDLKNDTYKSYNTINSEISRDGQRGQLYFKFSKESSYDIEVGVLDSKHDIFSGLGTSATDGYAKGKDMYAQVSKYFDNALIIRLSASHESLDVYNKDSLGFPLSDGSITHQIETTIGTNVYSAIIEKRFINGDNELFLGAQYKYQKFNIDKYKSDGVDKPMTWGPTSLNIYMAYLENLYNIDDHNLLTLSLKLDHYEDDFSDNSTEHILRAGYVAIVDEALQFKLFANKSYSYPIFLQTTYSPTNTINPDLESAKTLTLSAEVTYTTDKTTFTFGGADAKVDNAIVFNMAQKKYVNSNEKSNSVLAYTTLEHKFDINNKVKIEYFQSFQKHYFSPDRGVTIQLFNTIGKFDFYNELLYSSDYTSIDNIHMSSGYNYSLGAIYQINRKLQLKLKGENLLDQASEVPLSGVNVPAIERRGLLTMEYTF